MSWWNNLIFGDRDETVDCTPKTAENQTSLIQDAKIRVVDYSHVLARLA
jgi:hypothetical protein